MKVALPIFMILALILCIFNLTQMDWAAPLEGKSSIALIGAMASATAFLLILILRLSRKVAEKIKK